MKRAVLWVDEHKLFFIIPIGTMALFGVEISALKPSISFLTAAGIVGLVLLAIATAISVIYAIVSAWIGLVNWAKSPAIPITTCASCCLKWSPLDHLTCPRCKETSQRIAREAAAIDPFMVAARREVEAIAPEEP